MRTKIVFNTFILGCKNKQQKKLEIGLSYDANSSFPGKQKVDPTTKKRCLLVEVKFKIMRLVAENGRFYLFSSGN